MQLVLNIAMEKHAPLDHMKAYGPLSDIETTASVVCNTDSCIKCLI